MLKVKIGGAVAAIALASWWHLHALTREFEKGSASGQVRLYQEQQAALEQKSAEEAARIAQEREELEAAREALTMERAALSGQRKAVTDALKTGLAGIVGQNAGLRNEISTVTDAGLADRYRLALARARAYELARAAQP